jgi:hypothetical protein
MNQVAALRPTNAIGAWTSRQLETIKRTVAKDTSDDEFNLFIEYAREGARPVLETGHRDRVLEERSRKASDDHHHDAGGLPRPGVALP